MRKLMIRLTALLAVVIPIALYANSAGADEPPGAKLYATYCAGCHGANGSGGMATAIGAAKYQSSVDDATIAQVIGNGAPTKGMPTWSKSKGGALTDDQIASIVAYLRSLAGTSASASSTVQSSQNTFQIQTRIVLDQTDGAGGETVITALLREYTGYPVSGVSVVFTRPTFWGVAELGTAKTGPDGIATIVLPEVPEAAREVSASFQGNQKLAASTDKIILEPRALASAGSESLNTRTVQLSLDEPLLPPDGSLITPNPPLLPTTLLVLVVGGIWTIYAYVVSQLYGIWKQGRIPQQRNTGRMNRV